MLPDDPAAETSHSSDGPSLFGDADAGAAGTPYRVLARKYRPAKLDDLIGQDALVRTLTNAFASGRVAHAFILTGVRGVGKTTTARIIARGLNCTGPDGKGGPTPNPCGVCESCVAVADDRHVDVIEMDAASRTGVADIRELIESVRYRPVSARTKVYIIDEVHMLSNSAFNALLKTLEEPPPHVKFVFATTEIRKVPVTVLSRCQRFDLRRLDIDTLAAHFGRIAKAEGVAISAEALALIARAADGSVRDGLSLLDQAMALSEGEIGAAEVRAMLGLADRSQLFDLVDSLFAADAKGALAQFATMYEAGLDPLSALQDLLELTHWITRVKLVPEIADSPVVSEVERLRGRALAERLSMGELSRAWQMLLKGITEVQEAPAPVQAAEMVLVRLAYASNLPLPADLVRQLQSGAPAEARAPQAPASGGRAKSEALAPRLEAAPPPEPVPQADGRRTSRSAPTAPAPAKAPRAMGGGGSAMAAVQQQPPSAAEPERPRPQSFRAVVELCAERREAILQANLVKNVHLVQFEPGRLELRLEPQAPANLPNRLGALLTEWTGTRWVVAISGEAGEPTLGEQAAAAELQQRTEVLAHPLVQAAMAAFPGATLEAIYDRRGEAAGAISAPPEPDIGDLPLPDGTGEAAEEEDE
jgi:DNA polymerase III subunit gamma/tau